MRTAILAALAAGVTLAAPPVRAQVDEGVEYSITPYLWVSGLDGSQRIGAVTGEVDVSYSELLDMADLVVPLHFEARGSVWALIAEVNFAALSRDLAGPMGGMGELDIDTLIAEVLAGWGKSAQVIFGARYMSLENTLRIAGPGSGFAARFDAEEDWVDPVIGARYSGPLSRLWSFSLRGDLAGFGLGSDLTWNLRAGFGVELSSVTELLFGYHALDTDYDDDDFAYDMLQAGPEIGVRFTW